MKNLVFVCLPFILSGCFVLVYPVVEAIQLAAHVMVVGTDPEAGSLPLEQNVSPQNCEAARAGDGDAALRVGEYYEETDGDLETALTWYVFAKENSSRRAPRYIESIKNKMQPKPISRAVKRAAGAPFSLPCRAPMKNISRGSRRSYPTIPTIGLYVSPQNCEAARGGDAGAAVRVGYYYEEAEENPVALTWYIFAKENGSIDAPILIGYIKKKMHPEQISEAEGRAATAPPDSFPCHSREIFNPSDCKAAMAGDADAAYRVAVYKEKVVKNLVAALRWYIFAKENGSRDASRYIDFIKKKMQPEQISEAEKLAATAPPCFGVRNHP